MIKESVYRKFILSTCEIPQPKETAVCQEPVDAIYTQWVSVPYACTEAL